MLIFIGNIDICRGIFYWVYVFFSLVKLVMDIIYYNVFIRDF